MDNWDKSKRSLEMSRMPYKGTKPEIILRKALFAKGFRYRINFNKLIGKPDIVLPKYHIVIFVNGCFWHQHENCKYAYKPKTNLNFWKSKFEKNKERDDRVSRQLISQKWRVIVVWECQISMNSIAKLVEELEALIRK
jgi:DNA mismatch endonuclease (patch repair protein)